MDTLSRLDVQLAPLRKLDDFLLGKARFQLPDMGNMERIKNRVTANLLYYQTNYFALIIAMFVLIGLFAPSKLVFVTSTLAIAIAGFIYLSKQQPALDAVKTDHPRFTVLGIYLIAFVTTWLFNCGTVLLFATFLPILLTLTHAALRLRNLKNKINEKVEELSDKKTPMAIVLEFLDSAENEDADDKEDKDE